MKDFPRDRRALWIGYILTVLVLLLLAHRGERTMNAVMGARAAGNGIAAMSGQGSRGSVASAADRDSLILAAVSQDRDPFQREKQASPAKAKPARKTAPRLPDPPRIRAIIYEHGDPMVKLAVGKRVSEWLYTGYVFEGWTVMAIDETNVKVHDRNRMVILSAQ